MKRSAIKRTGFIRRRKRLQNASDKRKSLNRIAAPKRAEIVEAAGCCDMCGGTENLCAHEFVQGNRVAAYQNEAVILILCNTSIRGEGCHQFIHAQPLIWSFVRCLALLKIRRPEKYNLSEACRLEGKHYDDDDVEFAAEIIRNPAKWEHRLKQHLAALRRSA
jgi:hypothetical protein